MSMSAARIAVEWSYKDLKQNFTVLDFKRKLKVNEAPIGLLFLSSVLLWNFKVCLGHGGEISSAFQSSPPSLDEYLDAT
jgi:hypothetical protein